MGARDRRAVRPAFQPRAGWAEGSPYSDVIHRRGDGALVSSGHDLGLPERQRLLLLLLLRHPGRLLTAEELSAHAWGEARASRDAVASVVKRVRRRLREVGLDDDCLVTVRGLGYRWDEPGYAAALEMHRAS
jgi:DNA-binding response OmpR family regulator